MSTTTTNLGLIKPALTDAADITAMNANWDALDEEITSFKTLATLRSTAITETAVAQTESTIKHYLLSGTDYVADDLPSDAYKYSTATIIKRYGNATIILWGFSTSTKVAINHYNSSTKKWGGWQLLYDSGNKPTAEDLGVVTAYGVGNNTFGNDLDLWTKPGFYSTNVSTTNCPSEAGTVYATVLVLGTFAYPTRITQVYIPWINENKGVFYTRCLDNGTWSNWVSLYSTGNKPTPDEIGAAASWDVLWENAAPNSSFPAQTISIDDLSKYNLFKITARVSSSNSKRFNIEYYRPETEVGQFELTRFNGDQGAWTSWERLVTIDRANETIKFDSGRYSYSGSTTFSDNCAVPIYILGSKV